MAKKPFGGDDFEASGIGIFPGLLSPQRSTRPFDEAIVGLL